MDRTMADTKRNALAEPAERLEGNREFFTYKYDRRDIVTAQRIVAELAKADLGEIHMAATLPKDGREVLSCIDAAVWNATDAVEKCRAIAEEGGVK